MLHRLISRGDPALGRRVYKLAGWLARAVEEMGRNRRAGVNHPTGQQGLKPRTPRGAGAGAGTQMKGLIHGSLICGQHEEGMPHHPQASRST